MCWSVCLSVCPSQYLDFLFTSNVYIMSNVTLSVCLSSIKGYFEQPSHLGRWYRCRGTFQLTTLDKITECQGFILSFACISLPKSNDKIQMIQSAETDLIIFFDNNLK